MKELSIEQKAKAYDEALERARIIYQDEYKPGIRSKTILENLQNIFPELIESENERDERIRKELLATINLMVLPCDQQSQFVTWLEKQGEKITRNSIIEAWKDMRFEVYAQASGNRHEPNCSDNNTEIFSLNDIDEIIEKIATENIG